MTDFTHEWIASRGGLIATFSKPFRDMPQDRVGLSILATNDFPHALAALKAVLELHRPDGEAMCWSCDYGTVHPCSTVRTVEAALRGEPR